MSNKRSRISGAVFVFASLAICAAADGLADDDPARLKDQIQVLTETVTQLKGQVQQQSADISAIETASAAERLAPVETHNIPSRVASSMSSMNPAIAVIIDGVYTRSDLDRRLGDIRGFNYLGDTDDVANDGFDLREVEVGLRADIDPYFSGWAIAIMNDDGLALEEAVVLTTFLPWGLQLKMGKFLSDHSRLNAQHPHYWNFSDGTLVSRLLFGDGALNEKGVQTSWLAPTPFYLNFGVEALQGDNENAFGYIGEGPLDTKRGPRAFIGWVKTAPNLCGGHAMEVGAFAGRGVHQEAHLDIDDNPGEDRFLAGHQMFWGADMVYKFSPPNTAYGKGVFTVEGGYVARKKDVDLIESTVPGDTGFIGRAQEDRQDGLYLQSMYGFAPRWRAGLRGETLGITNNNKNYDGTTDDAGQSYRGTAMIDWTLTEFSRIRLQGSHGRYDFEDGKENVNEIFLQMIFTMGAHGAHTF